VTQHINTGKRITIIGGDLGPSGVRPVVPNYNCTDNHPLKIEWNETQQQFTLKDGFVSVCVNNDEGVPCNPNLAKEKILIPWIIISNTTVSTGAQ
jgi:hypothetical protein